ncbi:hypothetical protein [Ruegeria arenilitoris]|uniref:hypothetical protein n=1 Tax=Ruegeria arenilitoris TaxID=1173585 RepID=UPI00147E4117|nr:hypothetical protein [Ruegeria arenilitoris]
MSKLDRIIATNSRASHSRRKTGVLSSRARTLLLTLTTLLVFWIFYTQPQLREAVGSLLGG